MSLSVSTTCVVANLSLSVSTCMMANWSLPVSRTCVLQSTIRSLCPITSSYPRGPLNQQHQWHAEATCCNDNSGSNLNTRILFQLTLAWQKVKKQDVCHRRGAHSYHSPFFQWTCAWSDPKNPRRRTFLSHETVLMNLWSVCSISFKNGVESIGLLPSIHIICGFEQRLFIGERRDIDCIRSHYA